MKKYIIVNFIVLCTIFVSCEREKILFDSSQTFLRFEISKADLSVVIDNSGSVDVDVTVSDLSASERTINVNVLEDKTTAPEGSYTVGSIVIPANSYDGTLTISAQDIESGTFASAKTIELELPGTSEFAVSSVSNQLKVNVFQVCPIEDTLFVGNYTVSFADTVGPIGNEGLSNQFSSGVAFADDVTYTLVADPNIPGRRIIQIVHIPAFCSTRAPIDFTMDFTCGKIVVPLQPGECACSSKEDWHGPAMSPTSFDIDDDSTFVVKFQENASNDCPAYSFFEAEVTFTKV